MTCSHKRLLKTGRMAHWKGGLGRQTMTCLDCGMFWLWHRDSNYFGAAGMVGGSMWARLLKRKEKIDISE